ncbi:3D domain-containing protein [uncultured Clostridium sp.]|uniref:3D domain-containing protein n=1 Tax=uncultured Clostridium sp. TaxID=59620 RepID=UPI0032177626
MMIKFKDKLKSNFSIWPKTVFVVVLILLSAAVTIWGLRNTVEVVVDGQKVEITTLSKNLKTILDNNGITVAQKDKISVELDSEVNDGDIIYINKAVDVEIIVDGKNLSIASAEKTVKDMLEAENIKISQEDKITPSIDENLQAGMTVEVTRVDKELIKEVQPIAFETETRKNSELNQDVEEVVQDGSNGERTITTEVVYENGKEVNRRVVKEVVSKNPINKIIDIGTLAVVRPSRGGNSQDFAYSSMISCMSTAYTSDRGDSGTVTATGTTVRRNPDGYSTVAVDPRVIPLGTKLYIEGYGLAIAEDTGGAIVGNKVDVYVDSYDEAVNWGRRQVNVYILK